MCGMCAACAWNMYVICTNVSGRCLEYVTLGNMRGTGMDHAWWYGVGMVQPGIATTLLRLRPCLLSNWRHTQGLWMEYVWNMCGICREYAWNMYGIHVEYAWDVCGIFTECQCNMHGICMEYAWNIDGICLEYAQNMHGFRMEYVWNK